MKRPFQPKAWLRPKSYRKRDADAMERYGLSRGDLVPLILKTLYPQSSFGGGREMERPAWAKLAYERKWITFVEFYMVPEEFTGRILKGVYDEMPLLGMMRKSA